MQRIRVPRSRRAPARQTVVPVVVVALALLGARGALAFVGASGAGTGGATSPTRIRGLVVGGSPSAVIQPDQPADLKVYLLNGNPFPVRVSQVSAEISRVESSLDQCLPSDFVLDVPSGPPFDVPARGPRGDGRVNRPGTITLQLQSHDQSDCLNAQVFVTYDAS